MPVFETSKESLTVLLGTDTPDDLELKPIILGPLGIMLNWLRLCSMNEQQGLDDSTSAYKMVCWIF